MEIWHLSRCRSSRGPIPTPTPTPTLTPNDSLLHPNHSTQSRVQFNPLYHHQPYHYQQSIDPLTKFDFQEHQTADSRGIKNFDRRDFPSSLNHPTTGMPNSQPSITSRQLTTNSDQQQQRNSDWWEHVLPPGQLAQRLRKAQRSTTSSSSSSNPSQRQSSNHSPSHSFSEGMGAGAYSSSRSNPATATSTPPSPTRNLLPSERAIWSSFAEFTSRAGSRKGKENSSSWKNGGQDRRSKPYLLGEDFEGGSASGGRSAEGSGDEHGTHGFNNRQLDAAFKSNSGPSSRRSSTWEDHSGSGSNGTSPTLGGGAWLGSGDAGTRSFSRSTTSRRSRVLSEDGLGLGQAFAPGSSKTWTAGSPNGELNSEDSLRSLPRHLKMLLLKF